VIASLLTASGGRLRSIPEDTAHLTCAFLPTLPDADLPALQMAVAAVAAATRPVDIALGPPVVQYARDEARLVHLPLTMGADALAGMALVITEAIQAALPQAAVSATRSPHVTLARFARGTPRRAARGLEEILARDLADVRIEARVGSVQVIESQLTQAGARYVVRATAPLGPAR
jgi:2'-5' RNA ligase